MILYVVRHGETKYNKSGIYNGRIDEDINDNGIMQAEKLREEMYNVLYDKVYCSPMIRAKHTCDIINVKGIKPIYDDRLIERTLGKMDGHDIVQNGFSLYDFYNYYYKSDDPMFEDFPTLFKRVHNFLDEIIKENDSDSNILIVAHGGILRAIYFYFNTIPSDGNLASVYPKSANCELIKYEINK